MIAANPSPNIADLCQLIPYAKRLGVSAQLQDHQLTTQLLYRDELLGHPLPPALHGGAIGAFLEITAQLSLAWAGWQEGSALPKLAKTIDFTVDYMRPGRPENMLARAMINRSGRRYASIDVIGWQDDPARPAARGRGQFLMPGA